MRSGRISGFFLAFLLAGCPTSKDVEDSASCEDTAGDVHAVGETWDAGDGCNTCSCEVEGTEGSISCTELGCL